MSYIPSCLLFCAIFALAKSQNLVNNSKPVVPNGTNSSVTSPANNISVQCGNQIYNMASDVFFRKNHELWEPNERCAWLIRVENASAYSVAVFNLEFPMPESHHELSITAFPAYGPPTTTQIIGQGLYLFHGSVLVVNWLTGPSNALNFTGFMLQYNTHFEGAPLRALVQLRHVSGCECGATCFPTSPPPNPLRRVRYTLTDGEGWTSNNVVEVYLYYPYSGWTLFYVLIMDDLLTFEYHDWVLFVGRTSEEEVKPFHYRIETFICINNEIK